MGGFITDFDSRTNSPAGIDAIHTFVSLQGDFVLDPRCSMVMSPRFVQNISSSTLKVAAGAVLQILAGSVYGKRSGPRGSGDGPYTDYLKLFLRESVVFPGNVLASATRSLSPFWNFVQKTKNNAKGKSIVGHDRVGAGHNHKTVNTGVMSQA